jgi:PAS domain-containing protein
VVGLLAGAGYAALRWVVKPLGAVGEAARMIAGGDVNVRAPVTGPAEIVALAADVNLMATSLIKRSQELNAYLSQDLETRTAALERANEALTESEARLTAVVESAPLVLFSVDAEGRFTLSKGKGLAAFGVEAGEIDGRSAYELFADEPVIVDAYNRALKGESVSASSSSPASASTLTWRRCARPRAKSAASWALPSTLRSATGRRRPCARARNAPASSSITRRTLSIPRPRRPADVHEQGRLPRFRLRPG